MRKNCSSVRKKIEKKVCKFEAVFVMFPRFFFLALEQFFPQLVRNIMVTDYFFVYSYFFQCEEKKLEKFLGYGNNRK